MQSHTNLPQETKSKISDILCRYTKKVPLRNIRNIRVFVYKCIKETVDTEVKSSATNSTSSTTKAKIIDVLYPEKFQQYTTPSTQTTQASNPLVYYAFAVLLTSKEQILKETQNQISGLFKCLYETIQPSATRVAKITHIKQIHKLQNGGSCHVLLKEFDANLKETATEVAKYITFSNEHRLNLLKKKGSEKPKPPRPVKKATPEEKEEDITKFLNQKYFELTNHSEQKIGNKRKLEDTSNNNGKTLLALLQNPENSLKYTRLCFAGDPLKKKRIPRYTKDTVTPYNF